MKVKILKPSRLDGHDLPAGKTTNLPDELVPSWLKADRIKIVNPEGSRKVSRDTTKKQKKPVELMNLKREELLSVAEKSGLDIEIAKSMSDEELIEKIKEGTSEETQRLGNRESLLSSIGKKKIMVEGAKLGLDWKEMKSLSKEEIIVKIEEARKSQEEGAGEGSKDTDSEAGNSGQETS